MLSKMRKQGMEWKSFGKSVNGPSSSLHRQLRDYHPSYYFFQRQNIFQLWQKPSQNPLSSSSKPCPRIQPHFNCSFWLSLLSNNFIMKVARQRNLYLHNIFQEQPHKYSFDMEKGKYSLISQEGNQHGINLNGILKQRFKPNYSGCVDHRTRQKDHKKDPACMYFMPDTRPNNRYLSLAPIKFVGYAQFPYQIHDSPSFLKEAGEVSFRQHPKRLSTQNPQVKPTRCITLNSQRTMEQPRSTYRKACYNNKCRSIRRIAIDQLISVKHKNEDSETVRQKSPFNAREILAKSFHEQSLKKEFQQRTRLSKVALTSTKKRANDKRY